MVDGVGNTPKQNQTLKLKGKDGKTFDLNNLKGLQKTKQNEALFNMYDKDKNGIINEDEAIVMQRNLYSLSNGNGKISQREMKSQFGDNNKAAFEALSKLADQQAALTKGSNYTEVQGNTTTHVYKGTTDEYSYTYTEIKNKDGSTTFIGPDGDVEIRQQDGSKSTIQKDKTINLYNANGKLTKVITADGGSIEHSPDGNKITIKNPEGQITQTKELKNEQEVQTNYEYKDGQTIAKEYTGEGQNAQLTSITVSIKKDGHNIDTKYASEEDMKNNKPSESIQDAHNPTLKTITKYSYDSDGNVKAETKNSAGEVTTTYKNSSGETIPAEQFDLKSYSYTVPSGHSISQIVKDGLKQQGIENPTQEQINEARQQLLETNKDQVYTMKSGKYKGNKYFLANANITMPKFNLNSTSNNIDGNNAEVEKNNGQKTDTPTAPTAPTTPTAPAAPAAPAAPTAPTTSENNNTPQTKNLSQEQLQTYYENNKYVKAFQNYINNEDNFAIPEYMQNNKSANGYNNQKKEIITKDLNNFKNLISNWEDGRVEQKSMNGHTLTLTQKIVNGVPKYEFDGDLYDVGLNGFPILDEQIYEENLKTFNKGLEILE